MGTPRFALPSLSKLVQSRHQVAGVVTVPDKPQGRGQKLAESPVKTFAREHGLAILTPDDLKDGEFVNALKGLNPDAILVVAFRILPEEVFALPPLGTVNLHASLLPQYRGAAPINWAIINGETKTGLTTFYIRKKVDTGDILLQKEINIGPDETFGELHDRMSDMGAQMLLETVDLMEKGEVKLIRQDDSKATKAPKITPEHCRIDWSKKAAEIKNLIRGLSPSPGAFTSFRGKILKIYRSEVSGTTKYPDSFGEIVESDDPKKILVKTGCGFLSLLEVQPEGKKKMSGEEFIRGYRPVPGERFN
jgi:methionyl-tRNA formyltransferase